MAFALTAKQAFKTHTQSRPSPRHYMMIHRPHKPVSAVIDLDLSDPLSSPNSATLGASDSHVTVNISAKGKQHGHLSLPLTDSPIRDGHARLPVSIIHGSEPGPTVTLLTGIHGDEFEGPITVQNLAREISADSIRGRIILLPSINLAGIEQSQRLSPLDGLDMDSCFPGKPQGSISERIAFEVFNRFIRHSDLVVDLRSGGQTLKFSPMVAARTISQHQTRQRKPVLNRQQRLSEEAMFAFGAPFCVRLPSSATNSCLQGAVNAAGIAYIQTELGGGGAACAETLSIATLGCYNVLRQQGILKDDIHLLSSRVLEVRDESFYIYAEAEGILEIHARLGSNIYQGDRFASVITPTDSGAAAKVLNVMKDSVLLATRHTGWVKPGDLIAILADEVAQ